MGKRHDGGGNAVKRSDKSTEHDCFLYFTQVTYDDAINILKDERPHMAAIVGDAAKRQKEPVDWINTQKRLGEKKKKERLQARLHPFSYFDRR